MCDNTDHCPRAAWALFCIATLVAVLLLVLLVWTWIKYRELRKEVNKEKAAELEISNPINTHRWGTPDSRRDQALIDEEETVVVVVGGGGESAEGGGGGEEPGRSESGSYIRSTHISRDASQAGGGGGEGGANKEVEPRGTSGSIASRDYTEKRERWMSHNEQDNLQHHQLPKTIILPLSHQPVPGLTLEDDTRSPQSSEVLEDYVHMKSVSATNQYLRLRDDHFSHLARLPEDVEREREEGKYWEGNEDPADYELPLSKDGNQDRTSWIKPRQKGSTVPPSPSGVVATASGSQIKTHGYINVAVKEYDPDKDLFCSSVHHMDTPLNLDETPASVLLGAEKETRPLHPPYVNIDGEILPPENPPVPKKKKSQ